MSENNVNINTKMGKSSLSEEELQYILENADIMEDDSQRSAYSYDANTGDKTSSTENSSSGNLMDQNYSDQQKKNIEVILDVKATVVVELARRMIKIRDVLSLSEGSIIETDNPASEPVNLVVNDHLIGKGEVIVIDENFGMRVVKILSKKERINSLVENDSFT